LESLNGASINIGGKGSVNGNANVNGNALAHGSWGAKHSGKTLVGELGQEIVVDPDTGTWRTVGDNGAEFVEIDRGDIVFNHKQTEAILKHGKVAGRGKALANGTLPNGLTPLNVADSDKHKMFSMLSNMSDNINIGTHHLNMLDRNVDKMVRTASRTNNSSAQNVNLSIGDVVVQGVQDADALAKTLVQRLPNAMKQELFKR
jgi:hypothetical protein